MTASMTVKNGPGDYEYNYYPLGLFVTYYDRCVGDVLRRNRCAFILVTNTVMAVFLVAPDVFGIYRI